MGSLFALCWPPYPWLAAGLVLHLQVIRKEDCTGNPLCSLSWPPCPCLLHFQVSRKEDWRVEALLRLVSAAVAAHNAQCTCYLACCTWFAARPIRSCVVMEAGRSYPYLRR